MHRFCSGDKLFGFQIIFIYILTVLNSTNGEKWMRGEFHDNGTIRYEFFKNIQYSPCSKNKNRENRTHLTKIKLPQDNTNKTCHIDLGKNTNIFYKELIEKVTIDCNGRAECDSSHSELYIPRPKCNDNDRVREMHVAFSCKPADIDNTTVLDIGLESESKNITNNETSYLVLRLKGHKNIHRSCNMKGTKAISLTVLHVDFGPNAKCNEVNSNSLQRCNENMALSSRDSGVSKRCNYTWNPSLTFKIIECQAKEVDIDIHMSKGFVWIELTASQGFTFSCSDLKTNNEATSPMPSPDITTSVATTYDPKKNFSHTEKPVLLSTDGQQSNYLYDIVIPVSAAFLVLLIVIGSFVFCVCRRNSRFQVWKRNRRESAIRNRQNGAYNNVSTDDILDPTYNTVSAPGAQGAMKGISPGHTSDDDYADISHVNTANNSQPLVTSVAYKKPGKPMKTPTSPEPSFKVEKQAEEAPDEDLGVTYATVNKVKKVDNTEPRGAVTAAPEGPTLTEADGEYSHLAHFEKKKNYENVYNC